jgi:hypothetical protein
MSSPAHQLPASANPVPAAAENNRGCRSGAIPAGRLSKEIGTMIRYSRLTGITAMLGLILLLPDSGNAQTPDLTGKWELNKQMSVLPQSGGRMGSMAPIALEIEITLEDGKYTFKRVDEGRQGARIRYEESFTTDGESTENETEQGKISIKANWMNNSLMVDRTRQMSAGGGGRTRRGGGGGGGSSRGMTYTTTYSLNLDATVLIAFIDFGRMGADPITLGYQKKK